VLPNSIALQPFPSASVPIHCVPREPTSSVSKWPSRKTNHEKKKIFKR